MRIIREFFQIIAGNRNISILYFLLLPVFWIGSMSLVLRETQQLYLEYSRSDLLLLSFNEGGFSGIVFVFLILCFIMYLFRFDFLPVVLIRQKSKRSIWISQIGKATLSSFSISIYSTGVLWLYAILFSSIDNNWNSYNSIFTDELKFSLEVPMSIWKVVLAFFVSMFFYVLSMSIFYLLIRWLFHKEIIGCIAVLVYILYCSYGSHFLNYINNCTVTYESFVEPTRLLWPLLAPLLWIGVLLGAGGLLAYRAEFYSAGKK